jgi:putative transposase
MTLFKNKYRVESTRLKDHDYSLPADYYVTIDMKNRIPFFGNVEKGRMMLNRAGQDAESTWKNLPAGFTNIKLGDFIIMPDHVHGVISILKQTNKTLSNIVQAFKSKTAIAINKSQPKKCTWQGRFYDRIIRHEFEYYFVSEYIKDNPIRFMPGNKDKEWWELYDAKEKMKEL